MTFLLDCLFLAGAIFCTVAIIIRIRMEHGDMRDVIDLMALTVIASVGWNAWLG